MGDSPALLSAFRSADKGHPDLAAWHAAIAAAWCFALPLSRSIEGVLFAALLLVSMLRLRRTAPILGRALLDPVGLCILAWSILTIGITLAESGWLAYDTVLPGRQFLLPLMLLPIVHRWRLLIAAFTTGAAGAAIIAGVESGLLLLEGGRHRDAERPSAARSLPILAIAGLALLGVRSAAGRSAAVGLLALAACGLATFANRRNAVAVAVSAAMMLALLWRRLDTPARAMATTAIILLLAATVALPATALLRGAAPEAAPAGAPDPISPRGSVRTAAPLFIWREIPGATWYQVWLADSTGRTLRWWVEAERVAGRDDQRSTTAPEALPAGEATWWVRAWSAERGSGPWSAARRFSVQSPRTSEEWRRIALEWLDRASSGRMTLWGATIDAIGKRPWLGHGRGVWHLVAIDPPSPEQHLPPPEPRNRDSHNLALDLLFESGAVGLLCWIGVGVLGVRAALRRLPSEPALVLCLAMLAGWLASSTFDYPWARGLSAGIFFLFASITLFTRPSQREFGEAGLGVEDDWVDGCLPPPRR
jgi:hypothetical protein